MKLIAFLILVSAAYMFKITITTQAQAVLRELKVFYSSATQKSSQSHNATENT